MQLHGGALKQYIDGIIQNWDANEIDVVKVRKNNSNSKWLRHTASSGRVPAIYKTIMMVGFLSAATGTKAEPDGKKSVVHFRKMSKDAVGKDGMSFSDSPGKEWLIVKDKDITCLLDEFIEIVMSNIYPEQLKEIARQFKLIEMMPDTLTETLRGQYGKLYKQIPNDVKKKLIEDHLDAEFKELINKYKWIQDPKHAQQRVFQGIKNAIKRETGHDISPYMSFDSMEGMVVKNIEKSFAGNASAQRVRSIARVAIKTGTYAVAPEKLVIDVARKTATRQMGKTAIKSGKGIKKLR